MENEYCGICGHSELDHASEWYHGYCYVCDCKGFDTDEDFYWDEEDEDEEG